MNIRMLRLPDVMKATGLGRSTIYAKVAAGDFPAPVKLGARAVAWPEAVVAEWRIAPAPAPNAPPERKPRQAARQGRGAGRVKSELRGT